MIQDEKCDPWKLHYASIAKAHHAHFAGQQKIAYKYIRLNYEVDSYWHSVILRATKDGRTYDAGCQIWVSEKTVPNLPKDPPAKAVIEETTARAFYSYWFWRGWNQRLKLVAFLLALAGLGLELWLSFINDPSTHGEISTASDLEIVSFVLKAVGLLLLFVEDFVKRLNPS